MYDAWHNPKEFGISKSLTNKIGVYLNNHMSSCNSKLSSLFVTARSNVNYIRGKVYSEIRSQKWDSPFSHAMNVAEYAHSIFEAYASPKNN